MQVRLEYMYWYTSSTSSTCIPFKALYFVHYIEDVEDYRNICIVVSCINVEDVEDI